MALHEVLGSNMQDALERARASLGDQSVVVTHRATHDGAIRLIVSEEVPRTPQEVEELRREAKKALYNRGSTRVSVFGDTRDLERFLRGTGCSPELIERITSSVRKRLSSGGHPLDLAAEEIGKLFRIAKGRKPEGRASVQAFLGFTGVGKTTVITKLALRLARANRRVTLATLDAYRTSSTQRLRALGKMLRSRVLAVSDAAQLVPELDRSPETEVLLLDSTGNLESDVEQVRRLKEAADRISKGPHVDSYLVSPAVASQATLDLAGEAVRALRPTGCVITKLDETRMPASVLEHALREDLPLAFLSNGPDLGMYFHRPSGALVADLLLRGKLS